MNEPESGFAQLDGERPALVPPGTYEVSFCGFSTFVLFGRASKLNVQFKILTMGEHFEKRISRYYNVARIIGRPGPNGRFKCGFSSDFLREYAKLFPVPNRLDRIPMTSFEKNIFTAKVRTVEKGSKQEAIPDGLRYSVISELIGIKH
jgi:hypothetical protein